MISPNYLIVISLIVLISILFIDIVRNKKDISNCDNPVKTKFLSRTFIYLVCTIIPVTYNYFNDIISDNIILKWLYWIAFILNFIILAYWLYSIRPIWKKTSFISRLINKDFNKEEASLLILLISIVLLNFSFNTLKRDKFSITLYSDTNHGIFYSDTTINNYNYSYSLEIINISNHKLGIEVSSKNSQYHESLISSIDAINYGNLDVIYQSNKTIVNPGEAKRINVFNHDLFFPNFYPLDTSFTEVNIIKTLGHRIFKDPNLTFIHDTIKYYYEFNNQSLWYNDFLHDSINQRSVMHFFSNTTIMITDLNTNTLYKFPFYVFLKHKPIAVPTGKPGTPIEKIYYYRGFLVEGAILNPQISIVDNQDTVSSPLPNSFIFSPSSSFSQKGNCVNENYIPLRLSDGMHMIGAIKVYNPLNEDNTIKCLSFKLPSKYSD